jgi:FixJ family two-component response regulator
MDSSKMPMICIVDDDDLVRDSTESLIQSLGYRTLTFGSAERFLESGCVAETSCLITDIHMPGLNGLDLQSRLLAEGNPTPVIFITAYAEEKFRKRALGAGAVGFLPKPFSESSLLTCIDKALSKR